jgi:signal transduction histidine kinase
VIEIRDDGGGFDANQAGGAGHFGIMGMYERARTYGGELQFHSSVGHGTLVTLTLPVDA